MNDIFQKKSFFEALLTCQPEEKVLVELTASKTNEKNLRGQLEGSLGIMV